MWDTASKVCSFRLQVPSEVLSQPSMPKTRVLYCVGILSIILADKCQMQNIKKAWLKRFVWKHSLQQITFLICTLVELLAYLMVSLQIKFF